MKIKWIRIYIIGVVIAIIGTGVAIGRITLNYMEMENKMQYERQGSMLKDEFENASLATEQEVIQFIEEKSKIFDIRITLIEENGEVFYDSETKNIIKENHRGRPEVKEALEGKIGFAKRYSETLMQDYYYVALRVTQKGFSGILRICVPYTQYQNILTDLINTVTLTVLIAIVLVVIYVSYFMKKMIDPIIELTQSSERIAAGDYNHLIQVTSNDEIGRLATAFRHMTKSLRINEEILKSRNEELNAILSSMVSGVVALDYNYKVIFCNQQLERMLSLNNKVEVGDSFFSHYRSERIMMLMEEIREREESVLEEISIKVGKEQRMVRVRGTILHKNEKRKVGVLLVFEDITELKKMQRIRSDFVSNVTHELKTPLTSIRGFVETLQSGAVDDPVFARKFLRIIDIEANRLTKLIEDILLLSKIESLEGKSGGMVNATNDMVDVKEVAKEVIELLAPKRREEIELKLEVPENITPYFCNRDYLKEIILNLTDNALKYTGEGNVILSVKEQENQLVIQVKDTGMGISEEHLPRLFERFYRVDKGRSRKQGGTGLGLSIVKHITELYRGKIEVESTLEVGTTFTVILPYVKE